MILANDENLADLSQSLEAMQDQEVNHYTVPDCLASEGQQQLRDSTELSIDSTNADFESMLSFSVKPPSGQINELWREKICEWYYQIVDHYGKAHISLRCSKTCLHSSLIF